jgi:copper(I)-binding protein
MERELKAFLFFCRAFFVLLIVTACSPVRPGGPSIEVRDAWVRSTTSMNMDEHAAMDTPVPGNSILSDAVSAAYMIVQNHGDSADKLIRAESEFVQAIEFHKSELNGQVVAMRQLDSVEIPPGAEIAFSPGGLHMMLVGLKHDLVPGDKIPLVLVFETAGRISLEAEVRAP